MAQDHNDIYSIVERLRILEEGLDKNQRSVNQLSATFKPKTVAVLTAKKDPKNPMAGKLVGSDESVESHKPVLEADVSEDVLEKVKKSFTDFIKSVEDQIEDSDIKEKNSGDSDLKKKEKKDRDLVAKEAIPDSLEEDPTEQEIPGPTVTSTPVINPTYGESAPVKSVALNDGMICEIHGNERDGFEIRRGARSLPTRFKDISQAEMALEMYQARLKKQNESQDYLDEE
jgi:hypothetical protein